MSTMSEPSYGLNDFLNAELICDYILKNKAIQFQINGLEMRFIEARQHFNEREAIIIMKKLLLDEAERIINNANP